MFGGELEETSGETLHEGDSSFEPSVRGHHLGDFEDMHLRITSPGILANQVRTVAERRRRHMTAEQVDFTVLSDPADSRRPAIYAYDLVGGTKESADTVEGGLYQAYKEFQELPPEEPVKLVVDQRDLICKATCFGNHCKIGGGLLTPVADEVIVGAVKQSIEDAELGDVTVVRETATYSNMPPREVDSVVMTKETLDAFFDWKRTPEGDEHYRRNQYITLARLQDEHRRWRNEPYRE